MAETGKTSVEDYTDEELAKEAKNGDNAERALTEIFNRYRYAVNSVARLYFLSGGETDDLVQEGQIGIFRAIMTYNGNSAFKPYALKCIKTHILSAIKHSNREKNKPLNNPVSLSVDDGDDADKSELMRDASSDPEEAYINKENEKELVSLIKESLSKLEYDVLVYYLQGYTYSEIGKKTGKNVKSVDNTVQRIRSKINAAKQA